MAISEGSYPAQEIKLKYMPIPLSFEALQGEMAVWGIDAVTYSLGTCHSHLCWECLFCLAQLQATHSREQRHIHFSITKFKGQE